MTVTRVRASGAGEFTFSIASEIIDPTVNDDRANGFTVGSRWLNTVTNTAFDLFDDTPGAAVWVNSSAQPAVRPSYFGQDNDVGSQDLICDVTPGVPIVIPFPIQVGLQQDFIVGGGDESEFTGVIRTPIQCVFEAILVNIGGAPQTYTVQWALNGAPLGTGQEPTLGAGGGGALAVSQVVAPAVAGDDVQVLISSTVASGAVRIFRGHVDGFGVADPV